MPRNKITSNQRGITHLVVILIVVLVALVGVSVLKISNAQQLRRTSGVNGGVSNTPCLATTGTKPDGSTVYSNSCAPNSPTTCKATTGTLADGKTVYTNSCDKKR